ncbi:MAG: MBL fold metallo-hydrolase [Oscillospiraceae bacterium]|nr:MBL fold metallo-hydrolase [Oscillospiraceae bacterium]MBQ6493957.1 MBL fold metallo-hydrolase [Erysipelotrichaceae bacterium]
MKLTVLADNYTYIDMYYLGEPALSFYIEDGEEKILFDTGYSNVFISNAGKMDIDLSKVKKVVISHGHNDHTGGLEYLLKDRDDIEVISHPLSFMYKEDENGLCISSPLLQEELSERCKLTLSEKPVSITEDLIFLGQIPVTQDFEPRYAIGTCRYKDVIRPDHLEDDSALVYKGKDGLFVISGCSHSGICNIIEYAKKVCGDNRISGVIGGFHLFRNDERLKRTIGYFRDNGISELYPCHCVSLEAKIAIAEKLPIHEVGVGMRLEVE